MVTKIGTINNEDLIGTSGSDILDGRIGVHRMYGLAGDDILYGGGGNDLLDGGTGADTMIGGAGDDLYRVDSLLDVVTEQNGGGVDTVEASISYTLPDDVEKLTLTGSALNGTGNSLANLIKGNALDNILDGGAGDDDLRGGDGNDTLIGGVGKDTLTGGTGSDVFLLSSPDLTSTDRITDFSVAEGDWIGINAGDYGLRVGRGLLTSGSLDPDYFVKVSGSTTVQGTATGHGQFVFNTTKLTLMWDGDGAGVFYSGIVIATFSKDPLFASTNFKVPGTVINHNPVVEATSSVTINKGAASPAVSIGATDPDYDTFSYALKSGFGPTRGTVAFDQLAGSFTYTPLDTTYTGSDAFTIVVSDGYGGTAEQTATINIKAFAPLPVSHPTLVRATDTSIGGPANIGAVDPAGIVWVPAHTDSGGVSHPGTLFVSDSEVDEAPYSSPYNLFALNLDGSPQSDQFRFSLSNFTHEPTGLAYNPRNGLMYLSDDDQHKVFWVDPAHPTVKLGEFLTEPAGGSDPEDIAINPNNGNVFICNGTPAHTIIEVTTAGKLVSTTRVPDVVADMEALAYDPQHDVFFVSGGFSSTIWVVDRAGTILDTVDLSQYRNPANGTRVHVKDIAFASTSNPNDDPNTMNLYVADYGLTHTTGDNDGRVLEIDLGWHLIA